MSPTIGEHPLVDPYKLRDGAWLYGSRYRDPKSLGIATGNLSLLNRIKRKRADNEAAGELMNTFFHAFDAL